MLLIIENRHAFLSLIIENCPPPRHISGGDHDSPDIYSPVGTVVVYMCDVRHQFTDGTTRQFVTCLVNGAWDIIIEDCQRE